jgi:hypothetical protein
VQGTDIANMNACSRASDVTVRYTLRATGRRSRLAVPAAELLNATPLPRPSMAKRSAHIGAGSLTERGGYRWGRPGASHAVG